MDLIQEYLNNEKNNKRVKIALTDRSYKNYYEHINKKPYQGMVNTNLAIKGENVLKLCFSQILYDDNAKRITKRNIGYDSIQYMVDVICKHYQILDYIYKDKTDNNFPNEYDYQKYQTSHLKNNTRYIANAMYALIAIIYEDKKSFEPIIDLVKDWMKLSKD